MARPRKTLAHHKAAGTYEPGRHGEWTDDSVANGKPKKPTWLKGDAATAWKLIVESMHPDVLKRVDTLLLSAACKWWARWREYDRQLDDPEYDTYKVMVQAGVCWKSFDKALSKLGLSPVDRSKLRISPQEQTGDGKGRFFKVCG